MKNLFFVLLILSCTSGFAQMKLSEQAEISVITCGPWQGELYAAFGHSAFRVYDPANNIDEAYNYGVFDFNQPNFYLNFARGFLYYKLGVYDYQSFKNHYISYNRYVHEQILNLTADQKQKVYDYLQWNALPENEHYRYDYFYDNCATKMRDVIVKVLGDDVKFDGSYIQTDYSFREVTDLYLEHQPWGDLGIDICLGLPMDKEMSPYEYMFLPDYVESGFDHANLQQATDTVPLVKEKVVVYEAREEQLPEGLPHPLYVLGGLAVIAVLLSFWDIKRRKLSSWFDVLIFGTCGAIGLLLLLLWVATDHKAAASNLNLLWALPTHLVIAAVLIKQKTWIEKYFLFTAVWTLLLLILWSVLPQGLNTALIPVVIAVIARSFAQYWIRSRRDVVSTQIA